MGVTLFIQYNMWLQLLTRRSGISCSSRQHTESTCWSWGGHVVDTYLWWL